MASAISNRPVLAWAGEKSMREFGVNIAVQKLTERMIADPSADIDTLADAVATEISAASETLKSRQVKKPAVADVDTYVANKEKDQKRFASEKPNGAVVAPDASQNRVTPRYTRADLKSGKIAKAASDYLERMG